MFDLKLAVHSSQHFFLNEILVWLLESKQACVRKREEGLREKD